MSVDLPQTEDTIEQGFVDGLHFGAQVAVAKDGELIVDTSVGQNEAFEPLRTNHLMLWLSASKPIAAVAIGILLDQGKIDLQQTVASIVPEFANRGKERITLWHLLTHTAGIRGATLGWKPRAWEEAIGVVCATKPEPRWVPGEKAGYHVDSAWYMLGEIVRRVDGRNYERFVREEIFAPLGMPDCWVGMPAEQMDQYGEQIAWIYDCVAGFPEVEPVLTSDSAITQCRPGGNGRGPANQFVKFYEAMARMTEGQNGILRADTARELVKPHRVGMFDNTFKATMDWGLGFCLQSEHYDPGNVPYQYGADASRQTFGHCGNQSTAAFHDPQHRLSVVVLCNGMPGEEKHQARMRNILHAVYTDLGLSQA